MEQDITEFLGEKFEGFKGQEAINKLLQEKRGYIPAAFHKNDLGDIMLFWGDETAGLAHIIKRRTEDGYDVDQFLSVLGEVMDKGKIMPGKKGYFEILFNGKLALVSPEFRGKNLAFVLTAYRTRKKA